jgi:DnaJ-class molecular chaperone
MHGMRDPYTVLNIARGASDAEVKRAYRRLAKRLHPDLNPGRRGVAEAIRELNCAYELLSDREKRRRYDRGEIDAEGRERAGFGFGSGAGAGFRSAATGTRAGFVDFSIDEMVQEFLRRGWRGGGTGAGTSSHTAEPRAQELRISFLEAALGGRRQVSLRDGRSVEVAIPPGIDNGQKLRLKHADAGDVLLDVTVEPHPVFTRKDRDIHAEAAVPLADAVLGGSIRVPTIQGEVTVKVPKGANSGAILRLRGKGIAAGGNVGDHYVTLKLMLPEPADPELSAFLERWAKKAR